MNPVMRNWLLLVVGLTLLNALACSDDVTTSSDSGGGPDAGLDQAVAGEAGADGATPDLTDGGAPDAAIVTPGWVTSLGGSGLDEVRWGQGVKVDSKGNIYLMGYFKSDITLQTKTLTTKGDQDGWVAKLDSSGKLVWAVQIGGAHDQNIQWINGMCLDSKDTLHVVGSFGGAVTLGGKTHTSKSSANDGFIAALSPTDGTVSWSYALAASASSGGSYLKDCTFDSAGKLWAVGAIAGSYTLGSATVTSPDTSVEALVLKMSGDGSKVEWAAGYGGAKGQNMDHIRVASGGELYVTGAFTSSLKLGSFTATAVDGVEIYLAQLSSAGEVNWVVTGMGKGSDGIMGLEVDSKGNAYLGGQIGVGYKGAAATFTFGTVKLNVGTDREMFLAQVDKAGKVSWAKMSRWETTIGGYAYETIRGIALDKRERLIVTGQAYRNQSFFGLKLDPPNPAGFSCVLGRISGAGEAVWAVTYGHPQYKYAFGNAVAVDPGGDIVLVGIYSEKVNVAGKTLTSRGSYDIFVHKLTPPK